MYRTSLYLNSRIIDLREKHCRTVPVYNNLPFIVARSLFGLRVVSALTHPISINYVHKLCKSMQVTCHSIKHFHEQGTQVDPVTIMSLTLTWVSLLTLWHEWKSNSDLRSYNLLHFHHYRCKGFVFTYFYQLHLSDSVSRVARHDWIKDRKGRDHTTPRNAEQHHDRSTHHSTSSHLMSLAPFALLQQLVRASAT